MTLLYANNAAGTLAAGISSAATSLALNAGQAGLFPAPVAPDSFYATITDAATRTIIEIVLVTQVAGNVFTIQRGQDGTSARAWSAGDIVSQRTVAAELRQFNGVVPIGGIILWSGAANNIPENWALCNGSNGTPNLEDKFVVGAGNSYTVGATGGATTATLSVANLPPHNHGITDTGHSHGVSQSAHSHGLNDPGHSHYTAINNAANGFGGASGPTVTTLSGTGVAGSATPPTSVSGTGMSVQGANANVSINAAGTGITIQNTGSGTAFSTLPPYYALCYIMRVA
ncbi:MULTISPECIES: hypothetical protein [Burkholderia]|uniref:Phage tail protein n=1 Tax=Burkholderia contaminans TaxID=488447 RepID=A0A2S5DRN7_9BURK|nr:MULTISPECIES: hypothetical protein [Burkholderia]EKS9794824.1 hypothetical protein [Burkholderia cepacia]EKS9802779.1 hypothetical protein [Burkholderia cepacia]EKS9809286.1 hypothetical protein [Burkholderia cepacia]EKS9818147.1 hypothetical protein [Burkholderia cepacia]EKS9824141.1 hypothetical protein [Burkholderia cepacia]